MGKSNVHFFRGCQKSDKALHGRIIDICVRPELFQQLLLEHHAVAMLNKVGENLMYLRSQPDRNPRLP